MPSISVIIIAKNESANIAECVRSALLVCNDVIVCDGGSTDGTQEIAIKAGASVHSSPAESWAGFGIQRQRAQKATASDWCFWLDADERITPELAQEIKEFVSKESKNSILAVSRSNHAFGARIRHCGYYPDWVLRLHHREYTHYNDALVHEKLELPADAVIRHSKHDIVHYTYISMKQMLGKQVSYSTAWAENRFQKTGKSCCFLTPFIKAGFMFLRKYLLQGGILDGRAGFIISATSVTYTFNKYMSLYVLGFAKKNLENPKNQNQAQTQNSNQK